MKANMEKRMMIILVLMSLCIIMLTGCGGGTSVESGEREPDTSFLMGSWIAKTCTQGDVTVDVLDAFQGDMFSLYFQDDGQCQMVRGDQYALVDWTINNDGSITLKGTNTYEVTFPDDSRKTMILKVNDIDVFLEKYE